jgi:hypothetical protein
MRPVFRFAGSSIAVTVCACFLAACGGGGSSGSTPSTPGKVSVVSTQPWNDTGLTVTAGETLTVASSGSINVGLCGSTSATCLTTPNGTAWAVCAHDLPPPFTAPGLACWSLIGKVGTNGTPFQLGTSLTFTAPASGELFVGINDNYYPDNIGSWDVTVTK